MVGNLQEEGDGVMIVWGRAADIKREVAHVPDNWLIRFAVAHPDDIRKLGDARCSTLLYRAEAVLKAIETGECNRRYRYEPDPQPAGEPAVARAGQFCDGGPRP